MFAAAGSQLTTSPLRTFPPLPTRCAVRVAVVLVPPPPIGGMSQFHRVLLLATPANIAIVPLLVTPSGTPTIGRPVPGSVVPVGSVSGGVEKGS